MTTVIPIGSAHVLSLKINKKQKQQNEIKK